VLVFADESEALTHPYLARLGQVRRRSAGAGARTGQEGRYRGGPLDHAARRLIVHTSRTKRSANGPIHVSKATIAGLAASAHWLTVEWLPKYVPELNDIEVVWHELKAHHLALQTSATPTRSIALSTLQLL
jgi:hypothetical protein